jgi:vacuolar protein sorting-associated protein VTA1
MPLAIPPELKKITPFIKRAEELDKDQTSPESRLVAYYLRQYAVHQGIPLAGSSPGAKTCLGHILGDLEKEKPVMDNFTRDEAAFLCRKFATAVFDKADNEDRAGQSTRDTAKTFYAAQSFLQMLEQFAPEGDESEQAAEDKKRILYSKWKATEILKAFKEGRTPTPGGYGEETGLVEDADDSPDPSGSTATTAAVTDSTVVETIAQDDDDFGLPAPPTNVPSQPVMPPPMKPPEMPEEKELDDEQGTEVELGPPPSYPGGTSDPVLPSSSGGRSDRPALSFDVPSVEQPPTPTKAKSSLFGFIKKPGSAKNATKDQLADATELTKFALAALEEKDGELAVERLQQALNALTR